MEIPHAGHFRFRRALSFTPLLKTAKKRALFAVRRMKQTIFVFSVLLWWLSGLRAGAQSYAISWSVIPGGGGVSSNGQYSLAGSIGQSAAGSAMSGGNYELTGGFWSLISVVQTAGAPLLSVSRVGGQVIISWPTPAGSWTLQQNSNLGDSGGWVASGYAIATNNGVSSIAVSGPVGNLFFRLSQP